MKPHFVLLLLVLFLLSVQARRLESPFRRRAYNISRVDPPFDTPLPPFRLQHGCALCRGTGNCSHAVLNEHAGVYCGDLIANFEPCCCSFRNECVTTIFSEHCECLTAEEVEAFFSAQFTLFLLITAVFVVLVVYNRMCGRPYKVMNSNQHHMLANSPSNALRTAPRETAADQELLEVTQQSTDSEETGQGEEDALNRAEDEDALHDVRTLDRREPDDVARHPDGRHLDAV